MRSMLAVLVATACSPDDVLLRGRVFEHRGLEAEPLAGAEVTLWLPSSGEESLDRALTSRSGDFEFEVPPSEVIALGIRSDAGVVAMFHGTSPLSGEKDIEDNVLFPVRLAELEAERERFAGCPGAKTGGAVVFGEVRLFELVDPNTGRSPLAPNGRVDVEALNEQGAPVQTWEACYLDPEGEEYDDTADFTGGSGRFAVFGVEPGLHRLNVRNQFVPNEWIVNRYPAWVPDSDDPVVLPQWPAWVEPL